VANIFHRIVENFYRSAYGQHRFLENVVGFDMILMRINEGDSQEKYRQVYGPGAIMPTVYSPVKTTRIIANIYSMSQLTEETSDLGEITFYTYDKDVRIGDILKTTINNKEITLVVKSKRTIGFGVNVVYQLTAMPDIARNLPGTNTEVKY